MPLTKKPSRHPNTREQESKPGECPPGGSKRNESPQSTPNETTTQRHKPPEGWKTLGQCEPQVPRVHKGSHTRPQAAKGSRTQESRRVPPKKESLRHENLTNGNAPTQPQTQLTKSGCSLKENERNIQPKSKSAKVTNHPGKTIKLYH